MADTIPTEPELIRLAMKHLGWLADMQEEIMALHNNYTWELVPLTPTMNAVGCKWVYKPKLKSDGTFERLKARPVAKGFNQKPVIDFYETFSPPVIKPATIRVVLTIALAHNVDMRQLNVKNACPRGSLTRPVYMEQPSGFKDPAHPTFICRLKRAPYGPRQAPRAWFNRFNTYLDHKVFLLHSRLIFIYMSWIDRHITPPTLCGWYYPHMKQSGSY